MQGGHARPFASLRGSPPALSARAGKRVLQFWMGEVAWHFAMLRLMPANQCRCESFCQRVGVSVAQFSCHLPVLSIRQPESPVQSCTSYQWVAGQHALLCQEKAAACGRELPDGRLPFGTASHGCRQRLGITHESLEPGLFLWVRFQFFPDKSAFFSPSVYRKVRTG